MRTQSNVYSFTIETAKESVCKTFFLNTLAISESFMRVALVKTSEVGMVKPDKRGRHSSFSKTPDCIIEQIKAHIRKYPSYESHYSRERTKKKYLGSHLNISKMYALYLMNVKLPELKKRRNGYLGVSLMKISIQISTNQMLIHVIHAIFTVYSCMMLQQKKRLKP